MQNGKKAQNRVFLIRNRAGAIVLLWMLLMIVLAPAFSSEDANRSIEGMVYCPLSRKFQPINPPEEKKELKPFSDICANPETKDVLFREIFIRNRFKQISLDKNELDELAFDFLAHGEPVLKDLPETPSSPTGNLVKQIGSSLVINNSHEDRFAWKRPVQGYSPVFLARPPTIVTAAVFTNDLIHQADELSRRISPRAPPARS